MKSWKLLAATALFLTTCGTLAPAQSPACMNSIEADNILQEQFGETPIFYGSTSDANAALWINEQTQSWTFVTYHQGGEVACLRMGGIGFLFALPGQVPLEDPS